eukprot:763611-Hanusia_phi.AAC.1
MSSTFSASLFTQFVTRKLRRDMLDRDDLIECTFYARYFDRVAAHRCNHRGRCNEGADPESLAKNIYLSAKFFSEVQNGISSDKELSCVREESVTVIVSSSCGTTSNESFQVLPRQRLRLDRKQNNSTVATPDPLDHAVELEHRLQVLMSHGVESAADPTSGAPLLTQCPARTAAVPPKSQSSACHSI